MSPDKILHFSSAFCDVLNDLMPGWRTHGGVILGPHGAAVRFSEQHAAASDGHVDIEFSFQDDDPGAPRLWDCITGFGATPLERARTAARIWGATSAGPLLEFKFSRKGEFADHFDADDSQGLLGWHCICSAITGYGQGNAAQSLQEWWLSGQDVLPAIAPFLSDLSGSEPHSIKIFFGGDGIVEVRIDGVIHEDASTALLSLDWPRLEPVGFLRVFVIALHRA